MKKSTREGLGAKGVDGVDVSYPKANSGEVARKAIFARGERYSARTCAVPPLYVRHHLVLILF